MRANHLYIHVPFCARRCVYCDFSIAVRPRVPVAEYLAGIEREWARYEDWAFDLDTLYLGGGTPSRLGGSGVARLLDIVRRRAKLRENAEVTLEANPEDVTETVVREWRAAGVNRLSLGVQSFDDRALGWMHRTHDAATARMAIATSRAQGFTNLSIDLIFALPSALEREWERDLDTTLGLDVPHISVYGLSVEPHTPLGRWVSRRDVAEAPEDAFSSDFMRAHDALTGAGYEHYEVSNYGQPGKHSRHNWAYWKRQPYGGLGPSAHEFDGARRRWNVAPYAEWQIRTGQSHDPVADSEELDPQQRIAEEVYLSLRTSEGLRISRREREHVARWEDAGWSKLNGSTLRLTAAGWLRLDALATDLTHFRSRY